MSLPLKVAGFQVTTSGRIWVTPKAYTTEAGFYWNMIAATSAELTICEVN
jgi:hypothetical protein